MRSSILLMSALLLLAISNCKNEEDCVTDETYNPVIEPGQFVTTITTPNPYFPLVAGTKLIYEGHGERIEVTVTASSKVVMGITCVVVKDVVKENGIIVEDTDDWFAQDTIGNVWYFGEDTKEYENGQVVSTEGSWEAGVDGAKPGIIMYAHPDAEAGHSYRQEYYACEAEDMAEIVSANDIVTTALGTYYNCVKTRDWTPLEPGVSEYKFYAPGIGLVREMSVGASGSIDLIEIQ